MLKIDAGMGRSRWGAALLAVAIAGCGGKAGGNHPGTMDNAAPGGSGGTTATAGPTDSDDLAGSNATAGVGAAAGSIGVGGSSAEIGGSASGGSGGNLPNGLTECPMREPLATSVAVSDVSGRTEQGTNGKVRVTVTKLEEQAPSELGVPADLKARHYILRGPTQDWGLSATISGLTRELIKEGDVLDFQLETSIGYIPFSRAINQVFGLFTPEGELLLFGADTTGNAPVPDLSFLGLEVSDGGIACGSGDTCRYAAHAAHFSASGTELDLQPGEAGAIGNLWVRAHTFHTPLPLGNCDDSGHSIIVGVKGAVAR
jgi:hypothetical protein